MSKDRLSTAWLCCSTAQRAVCMLNLGRWNPSAATGQLSVSLWAKWSGLSDYWQVLIGKRDTWDADDIMWQIEANMNDGTLGFFANGSYPPDGDPALRVGEWSYIAATFDGTTAKSRTPRAVICWRRKARNASVMHRTCFSVAAGWSEMMGSCLYAMAHRTRGCM